MWFSEKEMGENVSLLCQNGECSVFRVEDESGHGIMTFYDVFPGVYLIYNDFYLEKCRSTFNPSVEVFCIDHCRVGRIGWKAGKGRYVYVEAGDMQIDARIDPVEHFLFPLQRYYGLTIGFDVEKAGESLLHIMDGVSVNLMDLRRKFCQGGKNYIMRAGWQIEHIFSELYTVSGSMRLPYYKIKVLELLLFLDAADEPLSGERPYFHKTQVERVKDMEALLTANLERWYTLEELSHRFGFPLTAMKRCFQGVYGTSVYAYMKAYRMNAAALMLKQTKEPVAQIAGRVGYANPSKFSSAFQSVMGTTPVEYRKRVT